MRLKNIELAPLKPLSRIYPSRFFSLQQCSLKEIWASNAQQHLLPCSPSAYVGTAVHKLFELAFQGKINDEAALTNCWEGEISRLEEEMVANPVEKHLVPLEMSAYNYEVDKILAFKMARSLFNNNAPRRRIDTPRSDVEAWVQTSDGKVGGRIDFIKETDAGIEIIDYKTGSLTTESSNGIPREEYLKQIKIYGALYHAMHNVWPTSLSLVGLDQSKFTIEVNESECSALLEEAKKCFDDTNELIKEGLKPEDFTNPSPEACRYCLYRPACNKYWESRREDGKWPIDITGRIKNKKILGNEYCRVVVETNTRDVAIRGLSTERHTFLNTDIKDILFCDLGRDTSDGFYVEKPLTTGYVLQ